MEIKSKKTISVVISILGVLSVAYGMAEDNNVLFIVGLVFVIGGYLIIRRELKADAKRKIP